MKYLQAYPLALQDQARALIDSGGLDAHLRSRYPEPHQVRTDRALYDYVIALKNQYLRGADPLSKVLFDNKLQVVAHALGTHTALSRVQGGKLKAKREIRIAAMFRHQPAAFLRMITVHELAHLKEKAHDKAFFQLCTYMEPAYHQIEFDLRMVLTQLDRIGSHPPAPHADGSGEVPGQAAAAPAVARTHQGRPACDRYAGLRQDS